MRVNTEQSIPNQEHHLCERACGPLLLTRPFCHVTTRSQSQLLCDLFYCPAPCARAPTATRLPRHRVAVADRAAKVTG